MSTLQSQGSNSSRFEALADEVRQSPDAQHEEITSQSEHLSEKSVALQPKGIEVESSPPPDGGAAAWSVVVGAFIANFITFGVGNVYGIFQRAYTTNPDSPIHVSSFKTGFIGGTAVGFAFAMGPLANVLTSRLGVRTPVAIGVFCLVFALEMASLANQYWQLLLSQGILFGIGSSLVFIPSIGLPSQWFLAKRGIATGISSAGTGVGAVILSPVGQVIIDSISIQWALRIYGFVILFLGVICVILLRERTSSNSKVVKVQYKLFDFSVIDFDYGLYLVFSFLQMFGYTTCIFLVASYCSTIGISSKNASAVISIIAAGNIVGRIASGWIADKAGVLNTLSLFSFLAGGTSLVLWLPSRSLAVMIVFAAFWGFFAGGFWALSVPATARIVGLKRLGSAVSINFLAIVIPPIFATSIGSKMVDQTIRDGGANRGTPESYRFVIIWEALAFIFAGILLFYVRWRVQSGLKQVV